MRKYAFTASADMSVKKVMIYEPEPGSVYLFGYDTVLDRPGLFDEWYETVEDAERVCLSECGIQQEDWIIIDDPLEGCQDDIIGPVQL